MTVPQLQTLVGPTLADAVDLGRVAHLQDLRDSVHTLALVLPDPDADIAAGNDLPEVRQVDPVLQVVSRQSRSLQVVLVLDGLGPGPRRGGS